MYVSEGPPARALWDRVQLEMIRRGWSKVRLHRETGLSRSTIDGLVKGRRPATETVSILAKVLGIPAEEAFRLSGLIDTPHKGPPETDEAEDLELQELLAALPATRRKALQKILEDERERLNRLTMQAREDYERARRRVAEMAWLELGDRGKDDPD